MTSHLAEANARTESPYSPIDQLARVLAIVETHYVEPTQREKLTDGAIKGLVAELDPHSAYLPSAEFALFQEEMDGKFGGIGIEVDFRGEFITVIAPIEGSPAERAGVRPGDQILAINAKPMRGERLDKLIPIMRGPIGSKVTLTLRRVGALEPLTISLVRAEIHVQSVVQKRLAKDVAYVRLRLFQDGTHRELLRAATTLKAASKVPLAGVLLDLRNNPGGRVDEAVAIADEFLVSGPIYSTRRRGAVIDEAFAHDGGAFATVPVVVLVNEYSASSAELLAGALQDSHRAKIVGAQTFGKGSVQSILDLPGGAGMRLTTMRYYTPSGRSIQAEGIRPDVLLRPTKPLAPGTIVRERDIDGHLPAEGAAPGASGRVIEGTAEMGPPGPIAEVPVDPTKGTDFGLITAYKLLLEDLAAQRTAP